jgi:hypothetical protein
MQSIRSGSFESSRSVKNLERLSKKQSNNQATDRSGTVDFFFAEREYRLTLARSGQTDINSFNSEILHEMENLNLCPYWRISNRGALKTVSQRLIVEHDVRRPGSSPWARSFPVEDEAVSYGDSHAHAFVYRRIPDAGGCNLPNSPARLKNSSAPALSPCARWIKERWNRLLSS